MRCKQLFVEDSGGFQVSRLFGSVSLNIWTYMFIWLFFLWEREYYWIYVARNLLMTRTVKGYWVDLDSMWDNYSGFYIDILNTYLKNLLYKLKSEQSYFFEYSPGFWILTCIYLFIYFLQQLWGRMPLSHQNVYKC